MDRSLCLYLLVDAGKVPAKQRPDYVALAVRRAAPFDDAEFGLAWLGDYAAVWYWSRTRILDALGSAPPLARFAPAALFAGGVPEGNELQLLALEHGFEGRAWKQGRLLASRWWAERPDEGQWREFARGAGFAASDPPPLPQAANISALSWSGSRSPATGQAPLSVESLAPKALAAVGLLFCLAASFQLGAIGRSMAQVQMVRREAEQFDEALKQILAAREQADRDQMAIAELLSLRPAQSQLALMAEAAQRLPAGSWQLLQWRQTAPGFLEVTLRLRNPDLEALVAAWEASPMFTEVSTDVSSRRDQVTIKARVEAEAGQSL